MDKHSKRSASIFRYPVLMAFTLFFAGLFVLDLVTPDRAYSELENTTLSQRPSLSSVSADGLNKFFTAYTKYVKDQVVGRDNWVALQSTVETKVMQKEQSGGILLGKQQMMFPRTYGLVSSETRTLPKNTAALEALCQRYPGKVNVMLVPAASAIYPENVPAGAPLLDEDRYLDSLSDAVQAAGGRFVDVRQTLTAHKDEYIYYRTDHHWTSLGAYYAYCAWRGIEPNADEWTQEVLCDDFYGTTWNKVPLPTVPAEEITAWYKHINRSVSYNNGQYETDSIYERKYLSGSDQYAVFLNSNQAQTVIEGSGKSGKLLLIKDSYGNTFSQFPVEDYAEVHVLDLRFFKGDVTEYAKENGITDTLVLYGTQSFVKDTRLRF